MLPSRHQNHFLKRQNSLLTPSYFSHSDVSLEELETILAVPPDERSEEDIDVLTYFTGHIKVFADLLATGDTESHSECCKALSYEHYPTGHVTSPQFIFHAGDEASKFYVIISGSCSVLTPIPKRGGKTEYKQLAVLRQGECFGELALINYKPRAASVICREETHFAVLEREDYLRVLGKTHNGALQTKLNFLTQLPIFSNWNRVQVQALSYFFRERCYKRSQSLFHSGDPVTEVFIVTKGEFQLSKDLKNGKCKGFRGLYEDNYQVDVTVITSGELVGGEEAIHGDMHRYSCFCRSTKGEVMYITREDFLARMTNEATVSYLHAMSEAKEEYRFERVQRMTELANRKRIASLQDRKQKYEFQKNKDVLSAAILKEALMLKKATKCLLPGLYISEKTSPSSPLSRQTDNRPKLPEDSPRFSMDKQRQRHYKNTLSCDFNVKADNSPMTRKRTWGDLIVLKYQVDKPEKSLHSRQLSVVNFHQDWQRSCASRLDLDPGKRVEITPRGHATPTLNTVNLSLGVLEAMHKA